MMTTQIRVFRVLTLLLVLGLAILSRQPVAAQDTSEGPGIQSITTVSVRARQGWRDTGVDLDIGQIAQVEYLSGTWTSQKGVVEPFGALPTRIYVCGRPDCVEPLPNFPAGALVGRIGLQLLEIGNSLAFTVKSPGRLQLRMNDGDPGLGDNDGEIQVRILAFNTPTETGSMEIDATVAKSIPISTSAGNRVMFEYVSGKWTRQDGVVPYGRARPVDWYVCGRKDCVEPMPFLPTGTLIAWSGDKYTAINDGNSLIVAEDGPVYVGMNDGPKGFWDNGGTIIINSYLWEK